MTACAGRTRYRQGADIAEPRHGHETGSGALLGAFSSPAASPVSPRQTSAPGPCAEAAPAGQTATSSRSEVAVAQEPYADS